MTTQRLLLGLVALLASLPSLAAAPPSLTSLDPAGARRGTTVEVRAGGTFERWPIGVWVSGNGIAVKPAKDKGKLTVTVASEAVPGTYWLRLHDEQGASVARPFLVGLLPEVAEKEPNNEPKRAQKLDTADVVVNGRLETPGDVDAFAVPLRGGQTLVASVQAHQVLRSPMDAVLQIVSTDGFVLAQNDDYHGLDPQLAFTAPRDGTFIVRLFAFPAVPDASIRLSWGATHIYRLTLTTGGFADYPFPLAVPAAQPGTVELVGWNLPAAVRRLPVPVPAQGDVATLVHPGLGNAVQVRLEPHATIALQTPTSRAAPQALPVPATVTGRLDRPGASDFFTFAGCKGQAIALQCASRSLDLEVEPVLRLSDAAGKALAEAEPPKLNADAVLAFTPPQDGPYFLEVRDLHGEGGRRHVYRLDATNVTPDFAVTLATDRFVVMPGKPLEVPVTIDRRAGFKADIDLRVEGLPAGVTAKSAPIKAADKVGKLLLTAAPDAGSGPIRIAGTAPGLTRIAHAPIAELAATTADLWLTTAKPAVK